MSRSAWLGGALLLPLLSLSLGCADGEGGIASARGLAEYYSLGEDDSWTYRDSLDEDLVDGALIHARHMGDGVIELRRGVRWSDAEYEGELHWDTSSGLALTAWELGANVGQGELQLFEAGSKGGDVVEGDGWTCELHTLEPMETFFGTYVDTAEADCTGLGLSGSYVFGRGAGLVRFEGGGWTLDLVAPW